MSAVHIVKLFRQLRARREVDRSPALLNSAVLLTLGAAAIHFAVVPDHLAEYPLYGAFFITLGMAQVGLAAAIVLFPSRQLFAIGAAGAIAVMGLWLLSRTVGVPIAPVPWRPEAVGFPDVTATALEGISVVQFLRLLGTPRRPLGQGRIRTALKMIPMVLFAPLTTYLAVGAALSPMPAAYNSAPFVAGQSSTSLLNLVAPDGPQPLKEFTLTAAPITVGGHTAWAYNGTVPGPELRVTQGDRVKVILFNHLPAATSIHWHGINVPGAMDGVAGITQDAVPAGGMYVYEFIANEAGTYWYHSHQDAMNQIPQGLVGSIVVEPKDASQDRVRDYSVLVHSQPGTDALEVNGTSSLHLDAVPGDTVRLRITNGAEPGLDLAPLTPVLVGAPYEVAALDGHDLSGPQELGPQRIPLGMGQRADLVFTMPDTGAVRLVGLKQVGFPWSSPSSPVVTIGDGPVPAAVNVLSLPRFDLTRYGTPVGDPLADASHFDVTHEIILGGGFGFRNGSADFTDTFSGRASPYIPPINVREGQLIHLRIVNPGDHSSHPIHIHGHIFTVLAKNGHPLTGSPVHTDTVLVGPHETWDVAFKADNPGIWMLHCHILMHAASGMSMTINYEGVYTPFTMGTSSGNIPE
jgi:FtsP/CotA-like multicopper oxidase with cupredoxin domain